jgi:hypothetical protein
MKLLNKLFIITAIWVLAGCSATELDLQDSPNAVTTDKAGVDFLYNQIQLSFRSFFDATHYTGASATRLINTGQNTSYNDAYRPVNFNGIWTTAYAGILPDVDALLTLTEERKLNIHSGSAKILKAYVLMTLVDMFGDVPLTEAGKGTDFISPKQDPGKDIYAAALKLLDEAITQLKGTTAAKPTSDLYYAGNPDRWVTLAKTLKLRAYLTTRLVDNTAKDKINALLAENDLIDTPAEDFQFKYGTNRTNPNTRHPKYNDSYETGDGQYQSVWFMWLMMFDKDRDNGYDDPRLRFYFYRQIRDLTPPNTNSTMWGCVHSALPDPLKRPAYFAAVDPKMPYCIPADYERGYYGRDHLNGSGIPPDGQLRTVYGVYPAGGRFDDNSYKITATSGTQGGLGAGIEPIILTSYVEFMRAEAAQVLGTTDNAKTMLEKGVRSSIAKVLSVSDPMIDKNAVIGKDPNGNDIKASALIPTSAKINEYVSKVLAMYDAAPDNKEKLNVIMKEYFIALFGNGIEPYNNYRRTGMPLRMQPPLGGQSITQFPRSLYYPSVNVNLNQNATQKEVTKQVFWDTNPAGFIY